MTLPTDGTSEGQRSQLPTIKLVPNSHGILYYLFHLLMFQGDLDTYWVTLFGVDGRQHRPLGAGSSGTGGLR